MIILKSEPKPDDRKKKKRKNDDDEKYGSDTRWTTKYSNANIAQRHTQKHCSDKHCDYE